MYEPASRLLHTIDTLNAQCVVLARARATSLFLSKICARPKSRRSVRGAFVVAHAYRGAEAGWNFPAINVMMMGNQPARLRHPLSYV